MGSPHGLSDFPGSWICKFDCEIKIFKILFLLEIYGAGYSYVGAMARIFA